MDFDQKKITKIHDFCLDFENMVTRLRSLSKKYPMALIIPVIESDLNSDSFRNMAFELNECDYLHKVFIALSAKDSSTYDVALKIRKSFKIPTDVVWCNKPEVQSLMCELKKKGLDVTGLSGKGKDVWIATGIASLDNYALAVHDADIVSYTKMVPTKMLYPVIEPNLDFFFAKGYYARVDLKTKKMFGRIYRLFISPLFEALQDKLLNRSKFLAYLQSFSYALSGEYAIYTDLAMHLRIPSHWGFEVGMLSELYRNTSLKRMCEVDLGLYEHKHKQVNEDELLKTAEDTFVTSLKTITEIEGLEVTDAFLRSLYVMYKRTAQDKIRQYHADAMCNNLNYDRHEEETTVDMLSEVILSAGQRFLSESVKTQMPDWLRTVSAMPDIRELLREKAIEA